MGAELSFSLTRSPSKPISPGQRVADCLRQERYETCLVWQSLGGLRSTVPLKLLIRRKLRGALRIRPEVPIWEASTRQSSTVGSLSQKSFPSFLPRPVRRLRPRRKNPCSAHTKPGMPQTPIHCPKHSKFSRPIIQPFTGIQPRIPNSTVLPSK